MRSSAGPRGLPLQMLLHEEVVILSISFTFSCHLGFPFPQTEEVTPVVLTRIKDPRLCELDPYTSFASKIYMSASVVEFPLKLAAPYCRLR